MKPILVTMSLAILIAISAPSITKSDYTPPEPTAPPKTTIEVIEVPQKVTLDNVPNLLLVTDTFKDAPVMVNVALAESSFNATAKNPTSSASGIFQIVKSTWVAYDCQGDIMNATDNVACAEKIYADGGTSAWQQSESTWHKN